MAQNSTKLAIDLTSAQLLALDTTPVTIETLKSDSSLAYLPLRLVAFKPAGTAYTCASPARLEVYDEDGNVWFSINAAGLLDGAAAAGRVQLPDLTAVNAGNATLAVRSVGALTVGDTALKLRIELDVVPILL